jgi:hypothetical protein
MAKKQFFLIVDTETTQDNLVADFGAVVVDRKGKIFAECGVLVAGIFNNQKEHPLFFDSSQPSTALWSKHGADKRYNKYMKMLHSGSRMLASVAAINRWLSKVQGKYDPILTAYNLPFDTNKCHNTEIDLTRFRERFCLWSAAFTKWAKTKKFKNFVLKVHGFNTPTDLGNMTYQTNAEIMTRFITGNPDLEDEPHTALEDVIFYELPILQAYLKSTTKKELLNIKPYNWREVQVKDHFTSK